MKHAMHYKFFLRKKKELTAGFFGESNADRKLDKAGTLSELQIMKSKFSTAPIKIPIIISDALGGVIIPDHEILMVAQILGFIKSNKGWHQIPSIFGDKKMRWHTMATNQEIRGKIMDMIARHFRSSYFGLDELYKALGKTLGEIKEDKESRETRINSMYDRIRGMDPFSVLNEDEIVSKDD